MDLINLEYGHKCRTAPVEAAIYSLQAKGEELEKFRAFAVAEVTVDLEESTEKQEKTQESSSLELPVDFTRDDVAQVTFLFGQYFTLHQLEKDFGFLTVFSDIKNQ